MEGFSLYFFDVLKSLVSYIEYDALFIVSLAIAVIPFLVLFSLSFVLKKLKGRRKLSYLLGEGAYIFMFASVSVLKSDGDLTAMMFYPCVIAAICILLYSILLIQSVFAKKIETECVDPQEFNYFDEDYLDKIEYIRPSSMKKTNTVSLDETKLKELIKKCYSMDLSPEDKDKVKKVDFLKDSYEMGINPTEDKMKLNDGISELINIVAKGNGNGR